MSALMERVESNNKDDEAQKSITKELELIKKEQEVRNQHQLKVAQRKKKAEAKIEEIKANVLTEQAEREKQALDDIIKEKEELLKKKEGYLSQIKLQKLVVEHMMEQQSLIDA